MLLARVAHNLAGVPPGAWETYALVGNMPVPAMPPAKQPDRSPCVQRDLERKDGPGAAYSHGVWRAAAGAMALWKDERAPCARGSSTRMPWCAPC
jgi:hypothetical protein